MRTWRSKVPSESPQWTRHRKTQQCSEPVCRVVQQLNGIYTLKKNHLLVLKEISKVYCDNLSSTTRGELGLSGLFNLVA